MACDRRLSALRATRKCRCCLRKQRKIQIAASGFQCTAAQAWKGWQHAKVQQALPNANTPRPAAQQAAAQASKAAGGKAGREVRARLGDSFRRRLQAQLLCSCLLLLPCLRGSSRGGGGRAPSASPACWKERAGMQCARPLQHGWGQAGASQPPAAFPAQHARRGPACARQLAPRAWLQRSSSP